MKIELIKEKKREKFMSLESRLIRYVIGGVKCKS